MALSDEIREKYSPTIGIETHVQLKTKTKLFSAVNNDAREAAPNSLISHIDLGLPGALPVLNEAAIELCARAAFALNTEPQKFSRFDRKHYFYPDLPKGYQITQYEQPIVMGGYVELPEGKKIAIERANLEEDAGKTIHPEGSDYSLVDLNRAGTPLLEIVSKPEISSAAEAKVFARELWLTMKYACVTDGDLYHGHVRFDVNVSISAEEDKKGTRSETKNLNSFRSVENAINYEIERQIELLEKGERVVQETRGWDEAKQRTFSQRTKEEAEDYRYMPEPDIPPVELYEEFIEKIKSQMPQLPNGIRQLLFELGINKDVIEDVLDRPEIVNRIFEAKDKTDAKNIKSMVFQMLKVPEALEIKLEDQIEIAEMVNIGTINQNIANDVAVRAYKTRNTPRYIVEHDNLAQVSDESEIEKIVEEVLAENPKAAEDVKNGEEKAIGFLVGQVMAKSQGRANPALAQDLLKRHLDSL